MVDSSEVVHIFQVVAAYWVVSISMVYLNKVLLSSEATSIPAPMFVTWFQCIITAAICIVLGDMGEKSRKEGRTSFLNEYTRVKYNMDTGKNVLPLSLIFVGMIAFNNICLKYVEVSFYNVARSLSIVFNVIFTYVILGKETSLLTCSTLLVVMLGFYLGIDGEINLSVLGTLAGVASSVFVSLNSIYTARVLPAVNQDKSLLLYYNNVNAAVLFLPFIILFESQVSHWLHTIKWL
jgi:GDP-fucose transporter C1